jgi:hypothetical protein
MHTHRQFMIMCLMSAFGLQLGCSLPRALWHGDDVQSFEMEGKPGCARVLLASRASGFKDALIARLRTSLERDSASLKVIGIGQLGNADAERYDAVVVVGSCIAWGLDKNVQAFLDGQKDKSKIVLLVTSGSGDWVPDKKRLDVDAVSSASKTAEIETAAYEVLKRIHARTGGDKTAP